MNNLLFLEFLKYFQFFEYFDFSFFLGIKSEISHYGQFTIFNLVKIFVDRLRGIEIYFLKTDFVKVPNHSSQRIQPIHTT